MDIESLLTGICKPTILYEHNQYFIEPKLYRFNDSDVNEFNMIMRSLRESDLNTLQRTPTSTIKQCINNCYAYDIEITKSYSRVTVIIGSKHWCFKIGGGIDHEDDGRAMSGSRAFQEFRRLCEKEGINLEDYYIANGKEVKNQIEKRLIYFKDEFKYRVIEGVHHIDLNASYPSGLIKYHPEFTPVIVNLYKRRKTSQKAKTVLVAAIGYMQSRYLGYKLAHLARDANNDNNEVIRELTTRLQSKGYIIIGYNTDGIWYYGGEPYHGVGEGHRLGEWKNDHINCKFRAKSDGAYEFIEDGHYNVVYRGSTNLDSTKSRSDWEWGDIFKTSIIQYKYDKDKGEFVNYEGQL